LISWTRGVIAEESAAGVGRNVFLDFLNRDTRQIFGVFRYLDPTTHVRVLGQALNLSVLLCRDICLAPPGFLAEDRLVRTVLRQKQEFRDARLIRLPIRETLDDFWSKKEREYRDVRAAYEGLFDKEGQRFVDENRHLLLDRNFEVGPVLVQQWEQAPDRPGYWRDRRDRFPPEVVELFRRVPAGLLAEGKAVTWASISKRITEVAHRHPDYRRLVQHIYFSIYTTAFDLEVIRGIPYVIDNFGLHSGALFYDFEAIGTVIRPTRLWSALIDAPASVVVALRETPQYFRFRRAAWTLCRESGSYFRLREAMALTEVEREALRMETPGADRVAGSGSELALFPAHRRQDLEAFAERLSLAAEAGLRRLEKMAPTARTTAASRMISSGVSHERFLAMTDRPVTIGLFVPLREERRVLIPTLRLTNQSSGDLVWTGALMDGVTAHLYSADHMGRVPAAVATARYLTRHAPDALVVLGIAGGFAEADVEVGDILVPHSVADLASRKVTSAGSTADGRVRPEPYQLSTRLGRYLETTFDYEAWAGRARVEADWPDGRMPRFGPHGTGGVLASGDEVVASDEHRSTLLTAWPGLLGVEMEAGGVLAAVKEFRDGLPVMQVRAVSDMADPAKSNDEWRLRGVKTIAQLVAAVDWRAVLRP
jgi:nucleoside phosphorylase